MEIPAAPEHRASLCPRTAASTPPCGCSRPSPSDLPRQSPEAFRGRLARRRNHRRERGTPGIPHRRTQEATPCPAQESGSRPTARSSSRGASRFAIRRAARSRPRPAAGPMRSVVAECPPGNPSATGRTRPAALTGPWRQRQDRPTEDPAALRQIAAGPAARDPAGATVVATGCPAAEFPPVMPQAYAPATPPRVRGGSDAATGEPTPVRCRRPAAGGIRATEGEEGTDGPRGTRVRLIGLTPRP